MGKIFAPLKFVFIVFNGGVAILALLMIILTIIDSVEFLTGSVRVKLFPAWTCALCLVMQSISALGISGAYSEKSFHLKAFAACMVIGFTLSLVAACVAVSTDEKVLESFGRSLGLQSLDYGLVVGVSFGVAAAALLSLLASVFMIHQVLRRPSAA